MEEICRGNLQRRSAERSAEVICGGDLRRRSVEEICGGDLWRRSAEEICIGDLCRRPAEDISDRDSKRFSKEILGDVLKLILDNFVKNTRED